MGDKFKNNGDINLSPFFIIDMFILNNKYR